MKKTNATVDVIIKSAKTWQKEMKELRRIVLDCGLTEELKWGWPCYTSEDRNIVLIHAFKEYCALLFFKGALLKDAKGLLVQQTKNTQSARQLRFESLEEIRTRETTTKSYIKEAVKVERAGLKVKLKKTSEYAIPDEFQSRLLENHALRTAFNGLTPGRQRGYILHFSSAKQSATRASRVEKAIPKILDGMGLDDE